MIRRPTLLLLHGGPGADHQTHWPADPALTSLAGGIRGRCGRSGRAADQRSTPRMRPHRRLPTTSMNPNPQRRGFHLDLLLQLTDDPAIW